MGKFIVCGTKCVNLDAMASFKTDSISQSNHYRFVFFDTAGHITEMGNFISEDIAKRCFESVMAFLADPTKSVFDLENFSQGLSNTWAKLR